MVQFDLPAFLSLPFQVERRADDFQRLKERALESLLRMKRAGELDRMAQAPLLFFFASFFVGSFDGIH